jgi:hypothetical protein
MTWVAAYSHSLPSRTHDCGLFSTVGMLLGAWVVLDRLQYVGGTSSSSKELLYADS